VKTCYDFKLLFMRHVLQERKGFTEIRLAFDRYITSAFSKDSTSLEGVKLKEFLPHIETKSDLATYLAEHVIDSLNKLKMEFVVVYQTKSVMYLTLKTIHSSC